LWSVERGAPGGNESLTGAVLNVRGGNGVSVKRGGKRVQMFKLRVPEKLTVSKKSVLNYRSESSGF